MAAKTEMQKNLPAKLLVAKTYLGAHSKAF